jgi:hypothetical protein
MQAIHPLACPDMANELYKHLELMDGKVQSITTIFIVRYEVESIARILL